MIAYPFDGTEPCTQIGTEAFFPTEENTNEYMPAQRICHTCHHERECLEWAIWTRSDFGVFGGTSPKQRSRIRAARRIV